MRITKFRIMIRIENVTKTYIKGNDSVKALDNFSLSAQRGEFIVVKGPSGCGKTTLLLVAGGLQHPQRGKVFIDNEDLYELAPKNMAEFRSTHIGFVFQQYHLIPYLSILENVTIPSLAHRNEIHDDHAIELIEELGLKERMSHRPGELSAGEKQRTALARALLYKPNIILADEITGNLDDANSSIVLNKLTEFTNSGGTVMLVTHDEKAFSFADRIIEMGKHKLESLTV